VRGLQPEPGQLGHAHRRVDRAATGRRLPVGQLELQRAFGRRPRAAVLGDQADAAVEVPELGSRLDLTGRLGHERGLAGGADRQWRTAHVATHIIQ
jgi:hypothetical protein